MLRPGSVPEVPTGGRGDFLAASWDLLSGLAPVLERCAAEGGVVQLLTNPVDIMAECLRRATSLRPERILGYSLNDSARLPMVVARELGVATSRVRAWVLGEHGAGQVPLFSRVLLDGEPIALAEDAMERIEADIRGWFARWSALSGLGVHLDEDVAARYPYTRAYLPVNRLLDGTVHDW